MTPRDEVIAEFTARGEEYKLRLIADMPNETQMGLYYHQDYLVPWSARTKHKILKIIQAD
jgi:threonyl-tRNA synthetase